MSAYRWIGLFTQYSTTLALLAWVLATDPPHEVVFIFVAVLGGLIMIAAYQKGHSDAVKWARSLLPDD